MNILDNFNDRILHNQALTEMDKIALGKALCNDHLANVKITHIAKQALESSFYIQKADKHILAISKKKEEIHKFLGIAGVAQAPDREKMIPFFLDMNICFLKMALDNHFLFQEAMRQIINEFSQCGQKEKKRLKELAEYCNSLPPCPKAIANPLLENQNELQSILQDVRDFIAKKEPLQKIKEKISHLFSNEHQIRFGAHLFFGKAVLALEDAEKKILKTLLKAPKNHDWGRMCALYERVPAFAYGVSVFRKNLSKNVWAKEELLEHEKKLALLAKEFENAAGIDKQDGINERNDKLEKISHIDIEPLESLIAGFLLKGKKEDLGTLIQILQENRDKPRPKASELAAISKGKLKYPKPTVIRAQAEVFRAERLAKNSVMVKGDIKTHKKDDSYEVLSFPISSSEEPFDEVFFKTGLSRILEELVWQASLILDLDKNFVPTKEADLQRKKTGSLQPGLKGMKLSSFLEINANKKRLIELQNNLEMQEFLAKRHLSDQQLLLKSKENLEKQVENVDCPVDWDRIQKEETRLVALFRNNIENMLATSEFIAHLKKEIQALEGNLASHGPLPKNPNVNQLASAIIASLIMGNFDLHTGNAYITPDGTIKIFDNARSLPNGNFIRWADYLHIPSYRPGLLALNNAVAPLDGKQLFTIKKDLLSIRERLESLNDYFNNPSIKAKLKNLPDKWFETSSILQATKERIDNMLRAIDKNEVKTLRDLAFSSVPMLKFYCLMHIPHYMQHLVKTKGNLNDICTQNQIDPHALSLHLMENIGDSGLDGPIKVCKKRGIPIKEIQELAKNPNVSFEEAALAVSKLFLNAKPNKKIKEENDKIIQEITKPAKLDKKDTQ